jgi:hypothetical protein
MDALPSLLAGFAVALQPINLMWALVGSILGTAIGILPGIGPALTIALLLPVTAQIAPESALIMFAGILYGAMYGGSTTSILINTPGESGSMMTALEGNQMARRGRGAAALATAAIGSFVAGTIGTIGLTFLAPTIAELAFVFGPEDYFALMVLAFTSVSVVMGTSRVRGFIALFIGLALGVVGIDGQTAQARMVFGSPELFDGIQITIVLVSLFAVGETIYVASRYQADAPSINPLAGGIHMTAEDWRRSWKPWLRGTAIGFPIGALPAGGAEIPTFLSYTVERRLAAHPEEFGHGAIRGSRTGGRQQRGGGRCPGPPADAWAADILDCGDPAGGVPELWPSARSDAVHEQCPTGMGPDRLALCRQRHATGAQPASGRAMGTIAADPPSLPLCRHHGVFAGRYLGTGDIVDGPAADVRNRNGRLRHAALRFPDRSRFDRPHPRPDGGDSVAACIVDQPGRSLHPCLDTDLGIAAGGIADRAGPARDPAPDLAEAGTNNIIEVLGPARSGSTAGVR